jgi:hypothetical protein
MIGEILGPAVARLVGEFAAEEVLGGRLSHSLQCVARSPEPLIMFFEWSCADLPLNFRKPVPEK